MIGKRTLVWLTTLLMLAALAQPATAQEALAVPHVEVADQLVLDGKVTVARAVSDGPGFIVIHADGGGTPGPVIGYRALNAGENPNVSVEIDTLIATPTLFAMLHRDTGAPGVYEFATVEGADAPALVDGAPVMSSFSITALTACNVALEEDMLRIHAVTMPDRGWVVVRADDDGAPGPVLGQTLVNAGTTPSVLVRLSGDITPALWPTLHVDSGEPLVYEFGTVDGADTAVTMGDVVAESQVVTVPSITVFDQIVMAGDGMSAAETPTLVALSVLADAPGWLVVHADADGTPAGVLGYAPLSAGFNFLVEVELAAEGLTPVVWLMLHGDSGVVGEYEFNAVEGADTPVLVDDQVVMARVNVAPSMALTDQPLHNGTHVVIESVLMDAPGWLVIHASEDGSPGADLAAYPLLAGLNENLLIEVDPTTAGDQVFAMLHYDTDTMGEYEFGTVEGADLPVQVGGSVLVSPLQLRDGGTAADGQG